MTHRPSPSTALAALAIAGLLGTGCTERTAASRSNDPYVRGDAAAMSGDLDKARADAVMWKSKYEQANRQLEALNQDDGHGHGTIGEIAVPSGGERGTKGGVSLSDDFAFAKGSADLNAAAKTAIAELATTLRGTTGRIIIEGHTDDTPVSRAATKERFTDNWGLSAARAASVARALAEAGIEAGRLFPTGRAHTQPLGSDKARNRRVEIYLAR